MLEVLIKVHDNGYTVVVADARFIPPGGQASVQHKVFLEYDEMIKFVSEAMPKHNG